MWYELNNLQIKSPLVARFIVMLFFLSWSEQTWQTCYLIVQMAIYNENSYLGQISQDVG